MRLAQRRLAILPSDHGTHLGEATTANKDSSLPDATIRIIEELLGAP